MPDLGKHLLAQEGPERRRPLARARRAQASSLARERHQILGMAGATSHPNKAVVEDAVLATIGQALFLVGLVVFSGILLLPFLGLHLIL